MTAALLAGFVWLAFARGDRAGADVKVLDRVIRTGQRDVAKLNATLEAEQVRILSYQDEMSAQGQLPLQAPIEQDLRALSTLAQDNQLEVVRVAPLASREYPGLHELRYAFDVKGAMPDMLGFFKAVEDAPFWADISYLSISRPRSGSEKSGGALFGNLTMSLFSAVGEKKKTKDD